MKPDTISVRITNESELDADSADLTLVVEGSAVFSGAEAFKKAKELRALVASLSEIGIDESRVKLRSVQINSQSFALIKSSSAKYVVSIKTVAVELLPASLGVIASHKGAKLTYLEWNYSKLKETRCRLRREALAEALLQARSDAEVLNVEVLGIHELSEETRDKGYNREHIAAAGGDFLGVRHQSAMQEIGFDLGNSTIATFTLSAEFRVGPISSAKESG